MVWFLFLRGGRGVGRFSCVSRFWEARRERRRRGVPARGRGARAGGGALCEATTRARAAARRFQGAFSEERARVRGCCQTSLEPRRKPDIFSSGWGSGCVECAQQPLRLPRWGSEAYEALCFHWSVR